MKVESSFVIDGKIVVPAHDVDGIVIYESRDQETLYITSKSTGDVLTRIEINCDMSQGTGFVSSITYVMEPK